MCTHSIKTRFGWSTEAKKGFMIERTMCPVSIRSTISTHESLVYSIIHTTLWTVYTHEMINEPLHMFIKDNMIHYKINKYSVSIVQVECFIFRRKKNNDYVVVLS